MIKFLELFLRLSVLKVNHLICSSFHSLFHRLMVFVLFFQAYLACFTLLIWMQCGVLYMLQ